MINKSNLITEFNLKINFTPSLIRLKLNYTPSSGLGQNVCRTKHRQSPVLMEALPFADDKLLAGFVLDKAPIEYLLAFFCSEAPFIPTKRTKNDIAV